MRFFRVLQATPRFLIIAPLFGVMVALTAMAQEPIGTAPPVVQEFNNQTCTDFVTCTSIGKVGGMCPNEAPCALSGVEPFGTCRTLELAKCVNSQSLYGDIGCAGTCLTKEKQACTIFRVYKCK